MRDQRRHMHSKGRVAHADAVAIHDLVLSWLWPLWTPPPMPLQLYFQPVIGAGTALACRATAAIQPIAWASEAVLTCACHGLPTAACSAGAGSLPQHATVKVYLNITHREASLTVTRT